MANPATRVLVAGHDLKFFHLLQSALDETGLFEFRHDLWKGHNACDEGQCQELLDWADVVFCEWCLGNAVWYSNHLRRGQRLFIRFHLAERTTQYPRQLDLSRVERIAFVGPHIEREANARLGLPAEKTCVIPNLVDCSAYDRPKLPDSDFNLGVIGIVPRRKRLDLALETLARLRAKDDRYCLHVKGAHPSKYHWVWSQTQEREYYEHVWERINREDWGRAVVFDPPGDDVVEWFRMVSFILSPSDFESFHMAVGEGMCSGTWPVVWRWKGADELWPEWALVESPREAAELIEDYRRDPDRWSREEKARAFVRARYDREHVRDLWAALLTGI